MRVIKLSRLHLLLDPTNPILQTFIIPKLLKYLYGSFPLFDVFFMSDVRSLNPLAIRPQLLKVKFITHCLSTWVQRQKVKPLILRVAEIHIPSIISHILYFTFVAARIIHKCHISVLRRNG